MNTKYESLKKSLEKYGESLVEEIIQVLKDNGKGDSALVNKIDYKLIEDLETITVAITAPDYFDYVDGGRRAGATPPPYKPIMRWAEKKGIQQFRNKTTGRYISNVARAIIISKAIGRNGIKPVYAVKKSLQKLKSVREDLIKKGAVDDMVKIIRQIARLPQEKNI